MLSVSAKIFARSAIGACSKWKAGGESFGNMINFEILQVLIQGDP